MSSPTTIAMAMMMLLPKINPVRAEYQATIISMISDDVSEEAAHVVNGAHESGFGWEYEICEKHGDGGDGLYGLGEGYKEFACRSPEVQAVGAHKAIHEKGWPISLKTFRRYLGARTDQWPEAKTRLALWTVTVERINCACCL